MNARVYFVVFVIFLSLTHNIDCKKTRGKKKPPKQEAVCDENGVCTNVEEKDEYPEAVEYANSEILSNQRRASKLFVELLLESDKEERDRILNQPDLLPAIFNLANSGSVPLLRDVGSVLMNLTTTTDAFRERMIREGAIPPLLRMLESKDFDVLRKALRSIMNLASIEPGRAPVFDNGGLPTIMELCEHTHSDVKKNALGALMNLAISNDYKRKMLEAGVLNLLLKVGNDTSASNLPALKYIANTFTSLSAKDENRKEIIDGGGLEYLYKLSTTTDKELRLRVGGALKNLAIAISRGEINLNRMTDVVLAMLAAEKRPSKELEQHVADTFANFGRPLPRVAFEKLKTFAEDFDTQVTVARCLHNQATFAHANKEVFEEPFWKKKVDDWENSGDEDLEELGKKTREKFAYFLTQAPIES